MHFGKFRRRLLPTRGTGAQQSQEGYLSGFSTVRQVLVWERECFVSLAYVYISSVVSTGRQLPGGDTWLCCVALRPSQAVYFEIRRYQ